MKFFQALLLIAHVTIWVFVCNVFFNHSLTQGVLVTIFGCYCLCPWVKKPSDYTSYKRWWTDRWNWWQYDQWCLEVYEYWAEIYWYWTEPQ